MYTAGMSTIDPSALVGRFGNRLRTPMAGLSPSESGGGCVMQAVQQVDLQGVWMELRGLPPLVSTAGCHESSWESSLQSLEAVLDHCTPRWQAELAEVGFDPGPTTEWACANVVVSIAPDVAFETVLTGLATNYQAYPRIGFTIPIPDQEGVNCEGGLHISHVEEEQMDAFCERQKVVDLIHFWDDPRFRSGVTREDIELPPTEGGVESLKSLESQLFQGPGTDRTGGLP
jgi:hypothetical protein